MGKISFQGSKYPKMTTPSRLGHPSDLEGPRSETAGFESLWTVGAGGLRDTGMKTVLHMSFVLKWQVPATLTTATGLSTTYMRQFVCLYASLKVF